MLILLFCTMSGLVGFTQNLSPTYRFSDKVSEEVRQYLLPALWRSGIVMDTLSGVILSASLSPVQERKLEAVQIRYIAAYDLFVEARLSGSRKVISSEAATFQSTGSTPEEARRMALRQLHTGSARVDRLLGKLTADYQRTFGENCHQLLTKAAQQAERNEVLIALAIADAVPMDAPCYELAQRQRVLYYDRYQQEFCEQHLEAARRQLALEMPKGALEEIGKIDPSSTCAAEAHQLLSQAGAQLKNQQSAKAQFLRQVYQNQVAVEQARNAVISDLVKE